MKNIKANIVEIIKPPGDISHTGGCYDKHTLFLAGSIDMGQSINWQAVIEDVFKDSPIVIFNPRRDDWDSTWEQNKNNKQFYEQVNWELTALDRADVIAMFFADNTKSPISLLELGLWAGFAPGKLVVYCTDKFWRKGNVDIVCQRYGIPVHENVDTWMLNIKTKLNLI